MTKEFSIDGLAITAETTSSIVSRIVSETGNKDSFSVFTLNLDHVVKLRRDRAFRFAYEKARYVTADGMPIVWAGRLFGARTERVTGADLIEPLCTEAARCGVPVFLFGSRFPSLSRAAKHLCAANSTLTIAGICAPEQDFEPTSGNADQYIEQVAQSGARICFVALGAPKQEIFAERATQLTEGIAFVCIGAGLDFLAGTQKRAPRWVRKIGAEWLWRLSTNPTRLARRYFDCLLVLPSLFVPRLRRQAG